MGMRCFFARQSPKLEGSLTSFLELACSKEAFNSWCWVRFSFPCHLIFFLHTDTALCVKAEWTMVRQQQNKLPVCIHTCFCVSPLQPSHMPRKTPLIQNITHGHNLYKSICTSGMTEVSFSCFNMGLFPFKVQENCNFPESTTKSTVT